MTRKHVTRPDVGHSSSALRRQTRFYVYSVYFFYCTFLFPLLSSSSSSSSSSFRHQHCRCRHQHCRCRHRLCCARLRRRHRHSCHRRRRPYRRRHHPVAAFYFSRAELSFSFLREFRPVFPGGSQDYPRTNKGKGGLVWGRGEGGVVGNVA